MQETCISVVVPCFNEEKGIYQNLKKIHTYLSAHIERFEIIAVNDGSVDNTGSELEKARRDFSVSIISFPQNQGKGAAVRAGMMAGRCAHILFLDADLAIPIEELDKFRNALGEGVDVVIASRFVPGLKVTQPVLWYRKVMEHGFRLLRATIVGNHDIKDTQCGFKLFTKDAATSIFPLIIIHRFAFDAEVIFIAKKFGYTIKEMPITLQNPIQSHVRIFRDPFNMLSALLKVRLNDLRGRYATRHDG